MKIDIAFFFRKCTTADDILGYTAILQNNLANTYGMATYFG